MCEHGQIRAAEYARQILCGEASAEKIETLARKGEYLQKKGADTPKRNLIAHVVYFLFTMGKLPDYANAEGDFINNKGEISNLNAYEKIASRFRS